ncbi:uncharacterized protein C9orf153 homolog isoform 2-T3 [Trichechus inunguis]
MPLIEDTNPVKGSMEEVSPKCLLSELYAFVKDFEKESKKCSIKKTHNMSLSEAQKMLSQSLYGMSLISGTVIRRGDPQPVLMCTLVKKENWEGPKSMTDLLHHSLLSGSLSAVHKLRRSQARLAQSGIPPPVHTFPYEILIDHANSLKTATVRKKVQNTLVLCKLGISKISVPEKFIVEDKLPKYFLINPEKQFLDLKDLEWRYYKGLVKWTHTTSDSFIDIKCNKEMRFVESQLMPDDIFPPLVRYHSQWFGRHYVSPPILSSDVSSQSVGRRISLGTWPAPMI